MKESQARTKVVLRHLPPSISQAVLLDYVDSKYAGCYTWFSFRPGKASLKRQVFSRAYINFKRPEDVYDFYEDFDGHVFLNERGTPYRVSAEYAPYQRIPKPRSKKDIREGTITKDPDYLEFLEMLGKPTEYLPSAEVQLERREAEKAAALVAGGGKESIVVTPLMEFVRQRRAAKAAPQRSLSSKIAARSGGVNVVTSNLASHKRGLERSRSGPLMYVADSSMSMSLPTQKDLKEMPVRDHVTGQRREEQLQRKEREVLIERRKRDVTEAKEKKLTNDPVPTIVTASKGNTVILNLETSKDTSNIAIASKDSLTMLIDGDLAANEPRAVDAEPLSSNLPVTGKTTIVLPGSNEGMVGDTSKDSSKREGIRRKHIMVIKEKLHKDLEVGSTSPGQVAASGYTLYNQRHRPPVSPRVTNTSMQPQLAPASHRATTEEGPTVTPTSKVGQRRELSGRSSSRGALSPREQQSPSQQQVPSPVIVLLGSQTQSQQVSPQSDRGGKRPPRPQNVRPSGKEQCPTIASPFESEVGSLSSSLSGTPFLLEEKVSNTSAIESFSGNDRQDSRRVRNKDRPDRPVWTPRRRSDAVQVLDPASSVPLGASSPATVVSYPDVQDTGGLQFGGELTAKLEKAERGPNKLAGKAASIQGLNSIDNKVTELHLGAGQQLDGGRSQPGSGSLVNHSLVSGKGKYVESSSTRSARGARVVPGNVLPIQDHAVTNHGEQRSDSSLPLTTSDLRAPHQTHSRENSESPASSIPDKEKRKQDITPLWNETGGSHRSGDRRRDRNAPHGSKDSEGGMAAPEPSKVLKRGGSLALGSNEKQVWVAVQKSGPGT